MAATAAPSRRLGHGLLWLLVALSGCLGPLLAQDDKEPVYYAWEDPNKIKGADRCRQCHASEYDVWKKTPHAKGFKTLHRKQAAEDIAKKMGFGLIKRESLCLTCHYTTVIKNEQQRAGSGVSCESCHGAGADWINIHNQYGGKGFTHENETAEHKAQRIAQSRELGMRRPSDLYPVASRCFQCHTVPHEKLVNVGGHGTGSADFELVAWSQGQIRHNFYESFLHGDGTLNAERSPERKRLMYVLGRALDVEYCVRGLAVATQKQRFFKAMSRRLRTATGELRVIAAVAPAPQMKDILTMVREASIKPGNRAELMQLAEKIGTATRAFLDEHDGSRLAAVDPLIRGESIELPEEQPVAGRDLDGEANEETLIEAGRDSGVPAQSNNRTATPTAGNRPATTPRTTRTVVSQAVPVSGAFKRAVHAPSNHKTIGPGQCSGCHRHETQSTWWFDDAHYNSANPFFEEDPKYMKIAKLYGLQTGQTLKGNQICMDCHGTVVSGKESRDVNDGVSCESCHGPAGDYLDPHQEGEKADGRQRSGLVAALGLGMLDVNQGAVRAKVCADCHYITDERLLSAGHHPGEDFDYAKGMAAIKHWERQTPAAASLKSEYAALLASRGPVPKVRLAREAVVETRTVAAPATAGGATATQAAPRGTVPAHQVARAPRPTPPKPRPVDPVAIPDPKQVKPIQLPPFPEIDENMSVEEVLLLMKQRLDLLHELVKGDDE